MASTYPLEIVAGRALGEGQSGLKDKALEDALQQQTWDPSVKSLAVFPQVLTMMNEKLDWTQKLGDAFLAQQKDVLATAQALRAKARGAGIAQGLARSRRSSPTQENNTTVIKIEPDESRGRLRADVQPDRSSTARGPIPPIRPTTTIRRATWPAARCWASRRASSSAARCGATATGAAATSTSTSTATTTSTAPTSRNGNWNHNVNHRGAVPYRDQGVSQQVRPRAGGRRRIARRVSRARRRRARVDPARAMRSATRATAARAPQRATWARGSDGGRRYRRKCAARAT